MFDAFSAHNVTTPDGVEWRVGRQWVTRRLPRSSKWLGGTGEKMAHAFGSGGVSGDGYSVLVFVGLIVLVLIVVPVLLFGVELVIVGCLIAASVLERVLRRRPWLVRARTVSPPGLERVLEWRVSGWRRSRRVIDEVVSDLGAGREPDPASAR